MYAPSLPGLGPSGNVVVLKFEVAFSSFFLSRKARPPCLKSKPLTLLAKALGFAGDEGANEYNG